MYTLARRVVTKCVYFIMKCTGTIFNLRTTAYYIMQVLTTDTRQNIEKKHKKNQSSSFLELPTKDVVSIDFVLESIEMLISEDKILNLLSIYWIKTEFRFHFVHI